MPFRWQEGGLGEKKFEYLTKFGATSGMATLLAGTEIFNCRQFLPQHVKLDTDSYKNTCNFCCAKNLHKSKIPELQLRVHSYLINVPVGAIQYTKKSQATLPSICVYPLAEPDV